MALVRNTSISEGLGGRHIAVVVSTEANGIEEPNQLEVLLIISNGSMLLERSINLFIHSFIYLFILPVITTAQKIKFSIKDFFNKCDQIRR